MRYSWFRLVAILFFLVNNGETRSIIGDQPLANIAIHKTKLALDGSAYVKAFPSVLGMKVSVLVLKNLVWLA